MTIPQKIKSYLDKERIKYDLLEHTVAYSAMEIAGMQHVPGRKVVKSVIVKGDGKYWMCLLPSIHYLDFDKLKPVIGVHDLRLAHEEELGKLFPEYEIGAEPPFGHLYHLPVVADIILQEDDEIVFNAGTHTDMIRMKFSDYKKLVHPTFAEIGVHVQTIKG